MDVDLSATGKYMSRYIKSLTIIIFMTISGCYIIMFGPSYNISKEDKKKFDQAVYKFSKSVFDTTLLFVITSSDNAFSYLERKLKDFLKPGSSLTLII